MRHFAAKLTRGGGPPPLFELERIVAFADESPDGTTWVALKKPGAELTISRDSRAILIGVDEGGLAVLRCRLLGRGEPPEAVREWYDGHHAGWTFYRLAEPEWLDVLSLAEVPGRSKSGKPASETFSGTASFAYWVLDGEQRETVSRPLTAELRAVGVRRPGVTAERPSREGEEGPAICERPLVPDMPLYGVDFSGGEERGTGNPKIWVASWTGKGIALRRGSDPQHFGRRHLPSLIADAPGLWVIDFPFGIPRPLLRALQLAGHVDYLAWVRSGPGATELRRAARAAADSSGVVWSTRRTIDVRNQTTWFPLFEQLYRQTLTGAADVLAALEERGIPVAPFHPFEPTAVKPLVIEGFPGFTLRSLGQRATGYKRPGPEARQARWAILRGLVERGLPVPPDCQHCAVDDPEGDAVDALVLLYAAWRSSRRGRAEWERLPPEAAVEGWFLD